MCTSWSSANQISNFKFSAFFRVLFALWSLKYPHPTSQQTPRVSTELGMVVNLSYSFIPLQKISQKGVYRPVENPQKRAENTKMASNAPNKFSWGMRNKCPSADRAVNIFYCACSPSPSRFSKWRSIMRHQRLNTGMAPTCNWMIKILKVNKLYLNSLLLSIV